MNAESIEKKYAQTLNWKQDAYNGAFKYKPIVFKKMFAKN
jgi:hypothetical protein